MTEAVSIKELLEAGVHFGHQTRRWNPKMRNYIFTQRNGIHIIDLEKTVVMLSKAYEYVKNIVANGEDILFIGTKKQAQEAIAEEAKRCGMSYVNIRWLGGTLTNFRTIQARIDYLVQLEDRKAKGEFEVLPKKEALKAEETIERLNRRLGGIKTMTKIPGVAFIVDPAKEAIALAECRRMNLSIVATVDTDCNPDLIDYLIPANDDAIKAIKLLCSTIANAVIDGKLLRQSVAQEEEAQAMKEGLEKPDVNEMVASEQE